MKNSDEALVIHLVPGTIYMYAQSPASGETK